MVASMRQVQVLLLGLSGIYIYLHDPCTESGAFWTHRLEGVRGTPKGQLEDFLDILCCSAFLIEIRDL